MGVRARIGAVYWKIATRAGAVYLGAVSLIGLEAVAILLTFTTAWPIALPFFVLALGVLYLFKTSVLGAWNRMTRSREFRRSRP